MDSTARVIRTLEHYIEYGFGNLHRVHLLDEDGTLLHVTENDANCVIIGTPGYRFKPESLGPIVSSGAFEMLLGSMRDPNDLLAEPCLVMTTAQLAVDISSPAKALVFVKEHLLLPEGCSLLEEPMELDADVMRADGIEVRDLLGPEDYDDPEEFREP